MRIVFILLLSIVLFARCTKPRQFVIVSGQSSVSLDLEIGGRISSLKFGNIEILQTKRDSKHFQWGSTVWPSPQQDWKWPPPAWIDKEPYTLIEFSEKQIVVASKISSETQLQCLKNIRGIGIDSFLMRYTFINHGKDSLNIGIWENTRIPYVGTNQWEEERIFWELGPDNQADPSFNALELAHHSKAKKYFQIAKVDI